MPTETDARIVKRIERHQAIPKKLESLDFKLVFDRGRRKCKQVKFREASR